jgi:hypothetical protein
MPAVSQQQQKFMGIVRAIQKGDAKPGDFSKKARDAAKKMKKKDVKKFAATKHDDLPKKVKKKESVFAIKGKDIGKGYKIATEPDFIYDPEKKMKKESINEDGHTDVASVERKLKLIGQYTIDLIRQLQNMSNEDSLPSWWTDKITLAKDYIEKSRNYLVVPVEGFASDAQRRAAFASGYKEKGKKKKKNEDITSSGYSQLKKIAYGISVGLKDLSKGIRSQNDDMVLPEIEYIYDKAIEMKKMLKNKRFNESVNEGKLDRIASTLVADLNKEFTRYNPKKISDFNKLIKYLGKKMPRVPKSKIEDIAMTFDEIMRDEAGNVVVNSREQRARMKTTLKKLGMKESVNETPQKVAKLLIKRGNKPNRVKDMVKKHYKKAKKDRSQAGPSDLASYISFLDANESVNEGKGVEKILKMADEKSFGKIAGRTVDGMTAGLFKAVYDKAPQNSKDKIDKMNEKQLYVFMGKLWNKFGRQVKLS